MSNTTELISLKIVKEDGEEPQILWDFSQNQIQEREAYLLIRDIMNHAIEMYDERQKPVANAVK